MRRAAEDLRECGVALGRAVLVPKKQFVKIRRHVCNWPSLTKTNRPLRILLFSSAQFQVSLELFC